MKGELFKWIGVALAVLHSNSRWMAWNLFLAFVPLVLSVWLFRRGKPRGHHAASLAQREGPSRSPVWWLGFLVFLAFLPNAPYVLTDIIHLFYDVRRYDSVWVLTLILLPQYLLFILAGFEAYVGSLINLGHYLHRCGWSRFILGAELVIHSLSAAGIYLGRFLRFNSWDLITQPDALAGSVLDEVVGKRPLVVIIVTFVIITGLYWLMKQVTLAIAVYRKSSQVKSSSAGSETN